MTGKIKDLNKELKKYFGFDHFRGGQEEIIRSILDGNDTLIVMPTGGGKSLCYQLPALVMPGAAIVISPLIALMKDQVDALQRAGNPAAFINSSMSYSDITSKLSEISKGKYKLVYIAPERLESSIFSELLKNVDISFLAVDEAHCISEWGHDFRPSYMKIPQALKGAGDFPVAALTATATPEVREDIVKSLEMKNVNSFVRGFDRPNLSYNILPSEDKLSDLVSICKNIEKGSVIVYCGTRKRVEWFAKGLKDNSLRAGYYHAGMEPLQRQFVQESFISGKTRIICATNAFGMGIDKADVRAVVHCDLPMTLEAYYQEAGRAGRDGLKSECTVLYSPADRSLQEFFLESNFPEKELVVDVYNYLYDIHNAKTGFKPHNPVFLDDMELANRLGEPYFKVRSAINLLQRNEIITTGRSSSKALIRFTTSREAIREFYKNTTKERKQTLEAVLRSCSSEVFREQTEFDLLAMCRKFDIAPASAKKSLQALEYTGLLKYTPESANGGIVFLKERYSSDRIPVDFKAFEKRREFAYRKVDIMHSYATTADCKRNFILGYFGEADIGDTCGKCSSCKTVKPGSGNGLSISQLLLEGIAELDRDFTPGQIVDFLRGKMSKTVKSFSLDEA